MLELYANIRKYRKELGISQQELANRTGYKDKSAIAKIEKGLVDIPESKIRQFARELLVPPALLMGNSGVPDEILKNMTVSPRQEKPNCSMVTTPHITETVPIHKQTKIINVLGRVAAGLPIEAVENIIGQEEITEELARTGEFFGLLIKGDSMTPNICDGDIVIVRQQDDAENGDTVIATVNGTDAVCKRLRKHREGIELLSNNPSYAPMEYSNDEVVEKPVRIIGKVVELRRKF